MNSKSLKVVLLASLALAAIGLFVPTANAGCGCGAVPEYCGGNCGCDSCWSTACGYGTHHWHSFKSSCTSGCGSYGGCWNYWDPCARCYASWTSSSCGCGNVTLGTNVSSCGCGGEVSGQGTITVTGSATATPGAIPTPPVAPSSGVSTPALSMSASGTSLPAPSAPTPPITPPSTPVVPTSPVLPSVSPDGGGGLGIPIPGKSGYLQPRTSENGCILTVYVPYEAKVTINGVATKSTGSRRQFVSYGLQPGYTYTYEVVAKIVRDGKEYTEPKTISLTAGDRGGVAFGFNIPPSTDSQTASNF